MFTTISNILRAHPATRRFLAVLVCVLFVWYGAFVRVSVPVAHASDSSSEGAIGALVHYGIDGLGALGNAWKETLFGKDGGGVSGRSFIKDAVSRVTLGDLIKKGANGVGDLVNWFNNALNNQQDIADPSTFNTVYNNYITEYNYQYAGNPVITLPVKFNIPVINEYNPDKTNFVNDTKFYFHGLMDGDLFSICSVFYKFNYPGYFKYCVHVIHYYTTDSVNYITNEKWMNSIYSSNSSNYGTFNCIPYSFINYQYTNTTSLFNTFSGFFSFSNFTRNSNASGYYMICPDSYIQYISSSGAITNIDNSTRITDITNNWGDTITNIDNATGDTSYITTNESGDTYYIFPIFDEGDGTGSNGTFIDPQGYSHDVNNWTYDYSDRSYHFTENIDNSDNSVTTNDYSVTYGDEYVTIDKRVTTTDNSTNTTTNNYVTNNYYYAEYDPSKDPDYPTTPYVPDGGGGSGGGGSNTGITIPDFEFDGSWLSDAIGMIFVLLTSLMDHNNELLVNSGGYNANLNVSGTVDLNVNLPAPTGDGSGSGSGGGGSGGGSGDDSGGGSGSLQLLDVNQLVDVVLTPFNLIGSFLQSVAEGITAFIENTLSLMTDMTELLGGFGFFISSFFLWMPPEIRVVVISGFSILFGLSVIKLFRGG